MRIEGCGGIPIGPRNRVATEHMLERLGLVPTPVSFSGLLLRRRILDRPVIHELEAAAVLLVIGRLPHLAVDGIGGLLVSPFVSFRRSRDLLRYLPSVPFDLGETDERSLLCREMSS